MAILTPSWRVGTEKASVGREVSQSRKSWLVWSWERSSHRYLVVDGYKIAWSTVPRKFYLIQFHFKCLCMYKAKTLSAYIKSNYTYTNLSPFFQFFPLKVFYDCTKPKLLLMRSISYSNSSIQSGTKWQLSNRTQVAVELQSRITSRAFSSWPLPKLKTFNFLPLKPMKSPNLKNQMAI